MIIPKADRDAPLRQARCKKIVTAFKLRTALRRHKVTIMSVEIVDVVPGDLPEVLALNEMEVPHVGRVDIEQMRWFAIHAHYFRVARLAGRFAGFLIGLQPGTSYESPNYRWFCERYADFAYVDRVAVDASARRHGVASKLYSDLAAAVPASTGLMTCEVNVVPPNETSMRFHQRLGFSAVDTLSHDDGRKQVALLVKSL
jgi:predicted GNAT superfamily acetyltransferase